MIFFMFVLGTFKKFSYIRNILNYFKMLMKNMSHELFHVI